MSNTYTVQALVRGYVVQEAASRKATGEVCRLPADLLYRRANQL